MTKVLYHGSKTKGLKGLKPNDLSGRGEDFVYTTTECFFAAVLLHRPGASLVRAWGREEKPFSFYLVERKENSLIETYSGQSGVIYTLDPINFEKSEGKEEYVSKKEVPILSELYISDLWKYFLELEETGTLKIVYFKDRHKHHRGSDQDIIKTALWRINKYGDKIIDEIKQYQPHLLEEIVKIIKK